MFSISPPAASQRKRANTSPAPDSYGNQPSMASHNSFGNKGGQAFQKTDDIFDLFTIMDEATEAPTSAPVQNKVNNNGFDDLFADFSSSFGSKTKSVTKTVVKSRTTAKSQTVKKPHKDIIAAPKSKKKSRRQRKHEEEEEYQSEPNFTRPTSKSAFVAPSSAKFNNKLKNRPSSPQPKASGRQKKKKMKKIDVLPLLHKGIRANKFKLNGNKSKVRKFFVTDNNYFFCWDAVNVGYNNYKNKSKKDNKNQSKSGGFFSKITGSSATKASAKVDPSRSIPIRSIRSIIKNAAYTMQTYNFIPPSQKSLTISIVYVQNGNEKRLNFMNYEAFHNVLFYEGLNQLWDASKDSGRNLSEVFELYVDFSKDILPKHLRPQKFKWEPLGANDYNTSASEDDGNTLNPFFDHSGAHHGVNLFDPTANKRGRLKSF